MIFSGPPISTHTGRCADRRARATWAATSAAAIGWMRPSGTRTTSPEVMLATMASANSWNWVARRIVYGSPEASISVSWATFGAHVPAVGNPVSPTMDRAT